jgi:small subunit ribosomal protein S4
MKKKHKQYSRPKRPFDKERLVEEEEIKKAFGLKNKKEIWRSESRIKQIRDRAKKLISANPEEQKTLFERLKKIGLKVETIADVLSLDKEDYLRRRLQTIVVLKKLASTQKGARQLIVHKKVLVDGNVVDSPSYIVPVKLEDKISLKKGVKKKPEKVEEPVVEVQEVPKEETQELKEPEIAN